MCQFTKELTDIVEHEVQDMLRKGAIMVLDPKEDQFLSLLFLVKNRDQVGGGNHPVLNLKYLD